MRYMYTDIKKQLEKVERKIVQNNIAQEAKKKIINRSIRMGGTDDELKEIIRALGVAQWRLAEALNINEYSFSRKMRHELDDKTKEKVYAVLDVFLEVKS